MADHAILDRPIGWASGLVTFNEHLDADGVVDPTKVNDTYLVDRFDFSPIQFRDQRDGLHLLIGGDLGLVSSEFRFLRIGGFVKASTWAALEDRIAKLFAAFHPENAVAASPTTRGTRPLDFYSPTAEAPAGYSDPVRELFYGRPAGLPAVFERRGSGLAVPFALELVCTPPGRYMYAAESKVANAGNGWSVALPNWTAGQGYAVYPTLTLVLTSTGANDCTVRYVEGSVTTDLVLDLSGLSASAHTIVVELRDGTAKEGATRKDNLITSTPDKFWRVGPGGGTMSVPAGQTNLTSVTAAYRQARA